jgi:hypothetical protein
MLAQDSDWTLRLLALMEGACQASLVEVLQVPLSRSQTGLISVSYRGRHVGVKAPGLGWTGFGLNRYLAKEGPRTKMA